MKRVKQDIDNISLGWWLRSIEKGNANYIGCVYDVGYAYITYRQNDYGVVPTCII